MNIGACGLTDKGPVRVANEDSLLVDENLGLFAVADGLGGHAGGEVASRMAVEMVHRVVEDAASRVPGAEDPRAVLQAAIGRANAAIIEAGAASPALSGMGTTLVAALVRGNRLSIAHVGDSRIYLWRDGRLRQLTADHSLVAEQLQQGWITAEEARVSPYKNIVTRALGLDTELEADMADLDLRNDDVVLLCSDGLTNMLSDHQIEALLAGCHDPASACRELIGQAIASGGLDNVTAIVVTIRQEGAMAG